MSDPVHARFMAYSGFGDKTQAGAMDGKLFAKLCKETGIIDKKCTATDVDLIFARAKPKGGRKLDFGTFTDACVMLAEKRFAKTWKEQGKEEAVRKLYELIAGSAGPQANAVSKHRRHSCKRKRELACNNKVQRINLCACFGCSTARCVSDRPRPTLCASTTTRARTPACTRRADPLLWTVSAIAAQYRVRHCQARVCVDLMAL